MTIQSFTNVELLVYIHSPYHPRKKNAVLILERPLHIHSLCHDFTEIHSSESRTAIASASKETEAWGLAHIRYHFYLYSGASKSPSCKICICNWILGPDDYTPDSTSNKCNLVTLVLRLLQE